MARRSEPIANGDHDSLVERVEWLLAQRDLPIDVAPGPSFQFYPSDWLSDRLVMTMTRTARAVHLQCMCLAWAEQPPCSLPAAEDDLEGLFEGVSPADRRAVLRAWTTRGDRIWQPGLVKSYLAQIWNRLKKTEGGFSKSKNLKGLALVQSALDRLKSVHSTCTAPALLLQTPCTTPAQACITSPFPSTTTSTGKEGLSTSKGVSVFVGDPPEVDRNVGENPPTALFDLSNGSNGNGAETNGHAAKKRGAPSATLEAEIAWRVSRVWEVHLAAWRNYRQDRTGVRPKRDPQPHPLDILKPIRLALLTHDKTLLGPEDRERWERESVVRAAGVGIFHDPFLTGKTTGNDLASGGQEYLEHWRPWKPQRGKADPVPRFAEIYFNVREVGDAVRS